MKFVGVINEKGDMISKAPVEFVERLNLPHRKVKILLFDPKGRIALKLEDVFWNVFVDYVGEETPAQAAERCLKQYGVTSAVSELEKIIDSKNTVVIFKAVHNGPLKTKEKIDFLSKDDITYMIKSGFKFQPDVIPLLEHHFF